MESLSKNSSGHEDRSSRNSGLVSSDRIKMLDITRDKPIKVAVKVAVPVRDHPKFNFVGKLLGPKGNSMKRLQEDTMCKMAVLGRGSLKDRKKEEELRTCGEPRYAHLSEDLHIEISTFAAPAEAHARIAYALAEVRRFLVPDYHDDIRQEQMWEMQELSTTPSLNQTGEQNSPNSVTDGDTGDHGKMHINEDPSMRMDCEGETSSATTQTTVSATSSSTTTSVANSKLGAANITKITNTLHLDLSNHTVHPSAVAAAIHHQLTSAGMGMIKPATGVAAVTNLTPAQAALGIPTEAEATAPALALLEPQSALLHPALRGVKAVNIAGSFARKRPLLGVPRSGMNPTKRTVMTLLARVKNSQGIHAIQNPATHSLPEALQMITSPFILPQPMDTTMVGPQKESLSQGV